VYPVAVRTKTRILPGRDDRTATLAGHPRSVGLVVVRRGPGLVVLGLVLFLRWQEAF
jgi:hypothetical protein